jgi:hypothetical protein
VISESQKRAKTGGTSTRINDVIRGIQKGGGNQADNTNKKARP